MLRVCPLLLLLLILLRYLFLLLLLFLCVLGRYGNGMMRCDILILLRLLWSGFGSGSSFGDLGSGTASSGWGTGSPFGGSGSKTASSSSCLLNPLFPFSSIPSPLPVLGRWGNRMMMCDILILLLLLLVRFWLRILFWRFRFRN